MLDIASLIGGIVNLYLATGAPQYSFTFSQPQVANSWGDPNYTWAANFDGDNLYDIASASGSNVFMKIANGIGGFDSFTWIVPNQWGTSGYTFVGDFRRRAGGNWGAGIATAFGGTIKLYASNGSGFDVITSSVDSHWGKSDCPWSADFNNDTIMDIASASGGNAYMKLGSGTGTFTSATWTLANRWGNCKSMTFVGEFDGHPGADIASASGGNVYMKLSTRTGFTSVTWPVANQWGATSDKGCDFNGDHLMDIASISSGNNIVYVKLSTGTGFTNASWLVDSTSPWGDRGIFVGDFTGDGKCDIATFFSNCTVKIYESTGSGFIVHKS
jgi:hypothetical protein